MVAFDNIYIAPRVRVALHTLLEQSHSRKFWDLLHKLKSGRFDIPGLRVEKLRTRRGKVYSARLNLDIRVIFSMFADKSARSLVVWDVDHHDAAYEKVDRAIVPALFTESNSHLEPIEAQSQTQSAADVFATAPDDDSIIDGLILFRIPDEVLTAPQRFYSFEPQIDRYLRLTPQQEELLGKLDRAYLVQGSAGTGKTTLALFHALNLYESQSAGDVLLFTYQEELACVCRCYTVNLTGEEQTADSQSKTKNLRVFSYLEFARHYLRKQIANVPTNWHWINRETSLRHLTDILNSRPRWQRSLKAEDIYGYIYSILKGRFVPGTDQVAKIPEEFRRILKDYGTVPDNFEEILEVFAQYEQRLTCFNHKDEADLIRFCYESLKNRAVFSEQSQPAWIVIDELQDFTELEWKSLMLFWENNCNMYKDNPGFPFLSGDRNQNISRSGFRWQEVDTYVERILRQIHRPNAIEKVQLHQNFRNTRQIFELGEFLRSYSPDTAAADDPPSMIGRKPKLVIAAEKEFTKFLKSVSSDVSDADTPLVILSEDEHYIRRVTPKDNATHAVPAYLMPLRSAKGMEFEDVILYRLFSSLTAIVGTSETASTARLYDLWYMAVTRARQNLLIFLTPEDWQQATTLFERRFVQFAEHFEIVSEQSAQDALTQFFHQREQHLPNYHVIFLERVRAQQHWDEYRTSNNERSAEIALRLWRKCSDWRSLGLAYQEMGRFDDAIPYIRQTNLFGELGRCLEATGQYELAAQAFEEDGSAGDAARCYALAAQPTRAAPLYEAHHQWLPAAQCYAKAQDSDNAARCFALGCAWEKAGEHYQMIENWSQAAESFAKASKHSQAAEMFLQANDKLNAARSYEASAQSARAAELYVDVEAWTDAGRCFSQIENFEQAAEMYWRSQSYSESASAFEKCGQIARAAESYESAGDWQNALPLRIAEGDPRLMAICYERLGDYEQALAQYMQIDANNESAYCLEKLERFAEGADLYMRANNLAAAASMLSRIGQRFESARLYLLSGQKDLAIEMARGLPSVKNKEKTSDLRQQLADWAETNQRPDLAAAVYEELPDNIRAGGLYRKAMMFAKAADCFERAKKYPVAAELYVQVAKFDRAAECFKRGKQWKKAAEYYELLKRWQDAKEMYSLCKDIEGVNRCESASEWF